MFSKIYSTELYRLSPEVDDYRKYKTIQRVELRSKNNIAQSIIKEINKQNHKERAQKVLKVELTKKMSLE